LQQTKIGEELPYYRYIGEVFLIISPHFHILVLGSNNYRPIKFAVEGPRERGREGFISPFYVKRAVISAASTSLRLAVLRKPVVVLRRERAYT
jgi:hypothetical protein